MIGIIIGIGISILFFLIFLFIKRIDFDSKNDKKKQTKKKITKKQLDYLNNYKFKLKIKPKTRFNNLQIFNEEINEKTEEYLFSSRSWKDNKWVEKNMIRNGKKGIITWKQYDAFSNFAGIYRITINDKNFKKIYIGKSTNVIQRLAYHIENTKKDSNPKNQYITNALKYHGIEKATWEVLSDWNWTDKYDQGYNKQTRNLNDRLNLEEQKFIDAYIKEYGQSILYNQDRGGIDY